MHCEGQILYRWTLRECVLSIPYLHDIVECMYETQAFLHKRHIYTCSCTTQTPHTMYKLNYMLTQGG